MPTIMGLDVSTDDHPVRLVIRLTAEFILAALYYYLCVIGPLWFFHRLHVIVDGPVSCITEGIPNPDRDWWASWAAFCCLVAAPLFYWGEGPKVANITLVLLCLFVYAGITAMVFNDRVSRTVHWCGELVGVVYDWVVIAFWMLLLVAANVRDERPIYEPDPEVRRANGKQRMFVIVSTLFLATVSLAVVWVGLEYLSSHVQK